MVSSSVIPSDIADRVGFALRRRRSQDETCWLAFFLKLPRQAAETAAAALRRAGLSIEEPLSANHIYGHLAAAPAASELCAALERVERTCTDAGAEIIAVDLEDSAAHAPSEVINLFCRP